MPASPSAVTQEISVSLPRTVITNRLNNYSIIIDSKTKKQFIN